MDSYSFLPKEYISLNDPFCGFSKEKSFFSFAKGDHNFCVHIIIYIEKLYK